MSDPTRPAAIVPLDEAFGFAAEGMAAWMRHLDQRGLNHLPTDELRRDFVAFSDGWMARDAANGK
jgi:hypothetical protein